MNANETGRQIRAVIIDDEEANRNLIHNMLAVHCLQVDIRGSAGSAEEGYQLITQTRPDLVFLDIKMQEKSGFDLLRMFPSIDFNVIFVSAFDKYAIEAFEFNAVDYILKPVDDLKLAKAVQKAEAKIQAKDYSDVIHFIHSLDEKDQLIRRISLHHNDKVHLVDLNNICYVQAIRGYSEIVTISNQQFVSSKSLSDYENLLSPFDHFLRVNKSMIININHVKDYTKGQDCVITIGNNSEVEVSRRKRSSIIQYLKNKVRG